MRIFIFILLSLLLASCARREPLLHESPDLKSAISTVERGYHTARNSETWDVTKRPIHNRPWLAATRADRLHLQQAAKNGISPAEADQLLESLLNQGRQNFATTLFDDPDRRNILAALDLIAAAEREALLKRQNAELQQWAHDLYKELPSTEPHPAGILRIASAFPATPFVYAWIWNHAVHEWRGPNWHEFAHQRIYLPPADVAQDDLLAFYAPIIVQEIAAPETPDERDDMLGRAELIPDRKGSPIAHVDTNHPTLYGYIGEAYVGGAWHTQLNYSIWYHDHPALKSRDPEAGNVEGELIRITLDLRNKPMIAEAVYACGCYHRIYPTTELEEAAKLQYGEPESGPYSLGRRNTHKIDGMIPELAGSFTPAQPRPIVYVRSGFHLVAKVEFAFNIPGGEETQAYDLRSETEMETLPWANQHVSFFGRDGLVRGADRPEAWMMYPSGLYHAGTPRIRGAHKIHFDQYDYNDPALLDKLLRIPSEKETHLAQ